MIFNRKLLCQRTGSNGMAFFPQDKVQRQTSNLYILQQRNCRVMLTLSGFSSQFWFLFSSLTTIIQVTLQGQTFDGVIFNVTS